MDDGRDWCWDLYHFAPDEDPPDMCSTICPKCGAEFEVPHFVNYTNCPTETCTAVFDPGSRETAFAATGHYEEPW